MLKLIEKLKPKSIVSIHTPAACIDDSENTDLGSRLADKSSFPLVLDWDIKTPGSFGTWGKENGLSVITYELPDESIGDIRKFYDCIFSFSIVALSKTP